MRPFRFRCLPNQLLFLTKWKLHPVLEPGTGRFLLRSLQSGSFVFPALQPRSKRMRKLIFVLFYGYAASVFVGEAQEAPVAGGGTSVSGNAEISFSIGQAVALYAYDGISSLQAGVQQVYDFVPSGNTFLSSAGTGFEAVVYPNPVSDHVNVCCPSASHSSPCVLNILDNRGKRVGEHILQQAETRLDLSDFPSGLYMFVFLTEKGQVRAFRKVVKAGC